MTTIKRTKPKLKLFLLFTSALTLTLFSCSSPTNPDLLPSLKLTVDGVTSTEAFIKLSTSNVTLPASVSLSRNNKQINSFTLITADTTIVDNNLNPNQSYTYQASIPASTAGGQSSNHTDILSEIVTAQTMDTTSHNFTFETYTFGGQGGSSTLYDVAIINENDIWAVGQMYVYDSTGTPVLYNAVHWDGQKWELKRIKTEFRGNIITIELEGIFAFSPTDIWMVGSLPIHGDGQNWTMFDVRTTTDPTLSLSKAWGANTNDMYFVGRGGSIAHYNNGKWSKIESGTTTNINDIWGILDGKGGCNKYLAAGSAMLKINSDNKSTRINGEPNTTILSIWGKSNNLIYTAGGDGVALYKNNKWEKINRQDVNTTYRIRGQNYNDIFGLSSTGSILHFNGNSWHSINTPTINILLKLEVKGNLIAAVGWQGEKGAITIVTRN